jgi:hypothetical protein
LASEDGLVQGGVDGGWHRFLNRCGLPQEVSERDEMGAQLIVNDIDADL